MSPFFSPLEPSQRLKFATMVPFPYTEAKRILLYLFFQHKYSRVRVNCILATIHPSLQDSRVAMMIHHVWLTVSNTNQPNMEWVLFRPFSFTIKGFSLPRTKSSSQHSTKTCELVESSIQVVLEKKIKQTKWRDLERRVMGKMCQRWCTLVFLVQQLLV